MFLLVSGRHVGAHTDGHQHSVSIQISINLGKIFLRISRIRKTVVTRILARVFAYLLSFISQILDLIYWTVLIFILIYFEWHDTENQQFAYIMILWNCESLEFLCNLGQFIARWTKLFWIEVLRQKIKQAKQSKQFCDDLKPFIKFHTWKLIFI